MINFFTLLEKTKRHPITKDLVKKQEIDSFSSKGGKIGLRWKINKNCLALIFLGWGESQDLPFYKFLITTVVLFHTVIWKFIVGCRGASQLGGP